MRSGARRVQSARFKSVLESIEERVRRVEGHLNNPPHLRHAKALGEAIHLRKTKGLGQHLGVKKP